MHSGNWLNGITIEEMFSLGGNRGCRFDVVVREQASGGAYLPDWLRWLGLILYGLGRDARNESFDGAGLLHSQEAYSPPIGERT